MGATRIRDDIWRSFARKHGAQAVDGRGGKLKQIRSTHAAWTISLDTYVVSTGNSSTTYTRARALVNASSDLRFKLYRENAFTRLGTMLGMQDVHAGNPELDAKYVVRSNNESMIRSLLIDSRVYHPLLALPKASFELARFRGKVGNRPRGVAELRVLVGGAVDDPATLDRMLDLLRASLEQLARMGAITATPVDYPL
jgi:hypothetical protein